MTNKELLQSDLLDILFEHRNKAYGAYTLRREYNHRLLLALGLGLSIILLFIIINALKNDDNAVTSAPGKKEVMVRELVILPEKKEEEKKVQPEIKKEKPRPVEQKPVEKAAEIKNTTFEIVKDDKADKVIRTNEDLKNKVTSTQTTEGPDDPLTARPPAGKLAGPSGDSNTAAGTTPGGFVPVEREPEYPGGKDALMRFLSRHLATPEDLEAGHKKTVRVRFNVDKDGNISGLRVEQSGGEIFDKEVIRVCQKMPRWKPAIQNGVSVPVSYVLPVTFIGLEQ